MSNHTPGPWAVYIKDDRFPGIEAEHTSIVIFGDDHEDMGVRGDSHEEALANAQLIAAAPDLLTAAQAAWNCIGALSPTQARVEVGQMLTAAIAKATGAA